jgi:hypothetical protein
MTNQIIIADSISPPTGPQTAVTPTNFGLVQLFDLGWVFDPGYQRLLDNLAASPGAFSTVRVMKVFTNGIATTQSNPPRGALPNETGIGGTTTSGNVWPAGGAIDLSGTLNGLYELTRRNLIPFVVLGFFPDGVYSGGSPTPDPTCQLPSFSDPTDPYWMQIIGNWKTLVKAFFDALQSDTRFGATAISAWWFEVWNEPDVTFFWGPDNGSGPLNFYQSLYKATSDVVTTNGYNVQLGGPTVTSGYQLPTAQTLQPFISFVKSNALKCNFLSFHGKGGWDSCLNALPDFNSVVNMAGNAAQWAQTAGLPSVKFIINDEADMRANFAVPFLPRMTQQYPAWLTALMITHSLGSQYPFEFMIGSDNAELPIVGYLENGSTTTFNPAAFGQQRSIMTGASTKNWTNTNCPIDLLKVPAYNFYELLRLLGDSHGTMGAWNPAVITDIFHMITVAATHIGSVFCCYPVPLPGIGPLLLQWPLNYSIQNITWSKINWYQFQIDGAASNGYAQTGGPTAQPGDCSPSPLPQVSVALPMNDASVRNIRQHQELTVVGHATGIAPGAFNPEFTVPPYTTTVFWITEYTTTPPAMPQWASPDNVLDSTDYGTNVVLFWKPDTDPTFYSYEVFRADPPNEVFRPDPRRLFKRISPVPLRSALWVDTNPGKGKHEYYLRTLSASGIPSQQSETLSVTIS